MALLEVKDLHTSFKTKRGIVRAVNGVSYSVDARPYAGPGRRIWLGQECICHEYLAPAGQQRLY